MRKLLLACLASIAIAPSVASADQELATYATYIGTEDLYNSRGQRLKNHWQIIRQDRANYHKFGKRHEGDEWDPLFGTANARAAMEPMVKAFPLSKIDSGFIVSGNTWVVVRAYGYPNDLRSVSVELTN